MFELHCHRQDHFHCELGFLFCNLDEELYTPNSVYSIFHESKKYKNEICTNSQIKFKV